MTAQVARPFAALDGCPQCGAHRWSVAEIDGMPRPDTYRCSECNQISERRTLTGGGEHGLG